MLRTGTYLGERYEILELIGSGGMSDVYKAKCHKLNRLVAIKVLKEEFSSDENFVGKFKMEAQAAAGLSHPNIVNVYDVVDAGTLHYIVMELIEGITLKSYITKKGVLDVKEAIGIAIQVAQGIAAAHEQKIIHRDIKPQNIIISRDGKVKVADFGIARAATSQTMTASAVGSVHYISPEQARGGYCDARSDIYSLGITIYEMVTGRVPFEGDNTVTVALAHLEEPITRPSLYNPELPASLENIILKCTEKKAERRYDSVTDVVTDLRRVLLHPEQNFVTLVADEDFGGETVQISARDLEAIKKGQKTYHPVRDGVADKPVKSVSEHHSSREHEEVNPRLEKMMTTVGVIVAVLIVALLIVVFSKLGGLFHFRNGESQTVIQTESAGQTEILSDTEIYMPNVTGLPMELAENKLKESTLVMQVSGYEDSDTVPKGYVISQTDEEGSVVSKYSAVGVVISSGSDLVDLSQLALTGMESEAARLLLEQKKLVPVIQEEFSDLVAEGKITRFETQNAQSPQKAREGETVTIYVSMGSAADMRTVPDLTNITEEEALIRLADAQLIPGEVTKESSDTVTSGMIIRQDLEANSMAKVGSPVAYVVSTGPEGKRYVGAISETYELSKLIGPGAVDSSIQVEIRLKQQVDGKDVYKVLMQSKELTGRDLLPVNFPSIEGVSGVEYGEVEIVNTENGHIVQSYPVKFFETE